MAVLKTQCPECDAKIRLTVDQVGDVDTECPKCGHAFTAEAVDASASTSAAAPAKASATAQAKKSAGVKETTASAAGKKTKASAAKSADDDEDETPKKKKKKKDEDGGNKTLLFAGIGAGVLVLGGVVAVVLMMGGKEKPKPAETAAATPAQNAEPVKPKVDTPVQNAEPVKPKVDTPVSATPPKKKDDDELPPLPDPPKIRLEGSLVPQPVKPVVKPPEIPPLAPDEDPFTRAKSFVPDGPLPELPKLPERGVRPVLTLDSGGHTAFALKVFFTPDGKKVITVSKDKSVRVWDPETGTAVRTIRFPAGPGEEGMLLAASLSRNGKRLAVGGEPLKDPKTGEAKPGKNPIFIVSPETGALLRRIDAGSDVIRCMHFSNDGNRLAVGCADQVLQVFDVNTGSLIGAVPNVAGYEVKFNPQPNTNFVASLGAGGRVFVVDLKSRQTMTINAGANAGPAAGPMGGPPGGGGGGASGGMGTVTKLAWSNDGKFLALGGTGGVVAVYGLDGKLVNTLPTITAEVGPEKTKLPVRINEMAFMPGDRDLAVVGYHRFAGLVDANTGKVGVKFTGHPNTVFAADVSPDGTRVVSCGGYHEEVMVWSADAGKMLHKMSSAGAAVWAIAWSKDGKSIAWGGKDRPEKDQKDLPLEHTFRLDEFGLGGAPDSTKYVQTVTSDEGVGLLKAPDGLPGFMVQTPGRDPMVLMLGGRRENIYSATLLPKANAIVAGGIADIYLVNPATGKVSSNPFVGHTGNVLCVTPSPDGRYFATGSSDQTIRIWRTNLDEPLLNIFVAGREWIAWTPQGYYACSPQGEKLMAWQLNPGGPGVPLTSRVPTVHPAERFRNTLYKPAILKYLVPAGDLPRAMAMAVKFDKDQLELKNIADVLPPEVNLEGFGDVEVKAEKEVFTVKATAKGLKTPIKSMRLLVDGRPFMGKEGVRAFADAKEGAEVAATWDVPLLPGTHTFAVIADTGISRGMSKVGIAVRPGTPPKPNLYVLAMGVSDYPKSIGPLNFCASDARLLSDAFQKQSKTVFANIEVKLLTDKQCTKQGMMDGLKWLKSKMTPQDVGVVSFSGHGTRDPFGRFYLVPADMDPEDPMRTGFPGDVLKDTLDGMPGRLVAILDACHSGMAGNDGKDPPKADSLVRDLAAEDSGVIVMCASLGREYAIESKLTKAGFYTLGLVEGMSGHGDIDGDGVIYLHELDLYATTRVRQLSMGRQNPTFSRPPSVQPFPIARPEKPAATPEKPTATPAKPTTSPEKPATMP
jgi:predicted Zn finger-like uncharacterized protein